METGKPRQPPKGEIEGMGVKKKKGGGVYCRKGNPPPKKAPHGGAAGRMRTRPSPRRRPHGRGASPGSEAAVGVPRGGSASVPLGCVLVAEGGLSEPAGRLPNLSSPDGDLIPSHPPRPHPPPPPRPAPSPPPPPPPTQKALVKVISHTHTPIKLVQPGPLVERIMHKNRGSKSPSAECHGPDSALERVYFHPALV